MLMVVQDSRGPTGRPFAAHFSATPVSLIDRALKLSRTPLPDSMSSRIRVQDGPRVSTFRWSRRTAAWPPADLRKVAQSSASHGLSAKLAAVPSDHLLSS